MLWMILLAYILLRIKPESSSLEERERFVHPDAATNRV
jgi:hypothetical protein